MVDVFVLSSVRLHRDGLVRLLADYPGIRVVGAGAPEVANGDCSGVDVWLVDVATTDPALIGKLARETVATVIAFGLGDSEQELIATVEAGVAGFVLGEDGVAEVVESVRCAARGEVHCSAQAAAVITRRLATLASSREDDAGAESKLTARELQIIRLVDEGLSNKQIAQALHIQVATVKNHIHSILEKLNVSRRAEAAARVRSAFRERRADQVPVVDDTSLEAPVDPGLAEVGTRFRP